ncbi:MAG: aminotransferase class III-fold pyridoxal phosphate-dependent enzyme [Oligoflexales bacterium]|nr:aminotransferase class III-fold pyridoxal phosphate-dependent enzyme [Oligoflexales bacterium]
MTYFDTNEELFQVKTYSKMPLSVERGYGSWLYTKDGGRFLDLYGGHAVSGTGHCHPRVVAEIKAQAEKLLFYSNTVYLPVRAKAAASLIAVSPETLRRLFFVNSGSEANENAIKIARQVKARPGIISFEGGFHGRTYGAASATGIPKYRKLVEPKVPDHYIVPFEGLDEIRSLIKSSRISGIILEPIQSLAGIRSFSLQFLHELRMLCDEHDVCLIFDEVQTGMGRVGDFFFAGKHGIYPDMITTGKAMASGIPMGVVLMTDKIADDIKCGDLGSTFGGGPVASAALDATISVIRDEELLRNVRVNGAYLAWELRKIPCVKEVRGEGFLIGIKTDRPASEYQKRLFDAKIIVGTSEDPYVSRLLPPLTLNREEIDYFLSALRNIELK